MGFNWVIEFRQVILIDYFIEILEVNQVSEILFNKLGTKRFSQPFLHLNDGRLHSLNGALNVDDEFLSLFSFERAHELNELILLFHGFDLNKVFGFGFLYPWAPSVLSWALEKFIVVQGIFRELASMGFFAMIIESSVRMVELTAILLSTLVLLLSFFRLGLNLIRLLDFDGISL